MTPEVPPGLLASLSMVPPDAPCALLVRHADRAPFSPGDHGAEVGLTAIGEARAGALSAHSLWRRRPPAWCRSSPLRRCVDTARHLGMVAEPSPLLGDPGAFVVDPPRAGEAFLEHGTEAVVRAHLAGRGGPFLRSVEEGARLLLAEVATSLASRAGSGVLISHDTIVMPVIAWATGERFEGTWLDPLDGMVLVAAGRDALRVLWRGESFVAAL